MIFRTSHLKKSHIYEFLKGYFDSIEIQRFVSHCAECKLCRKKLFQYSKVFLDEFPPDWADTKNKLARFRYFKDYISGKKHLQFPAPILPYGCFSAATIEAYANNLLQPEERKLVWKHLQDCGGCVQSLATTMHPREKAQEEAWVRKLTKHVKEIVKRALHPPRPQ